VTLFFLIGLEKRDSFLPGTELQGVEQHPMAAHGALGFDGSGDVIEALLYPGARGSPGTGPASVSRTGKGLTRSEATRAAHRAAPQAELPQPLADGGQETAVLSHSPLCLHAARHAAVPAGVRTARLAR